MSQSFDDKLGKKLQGFSPPPPAAAKGKVFASLGANQNGWNFWQTIGVIFIIISLLQFLLPIGSRKSSVISSENENTATLQFAEEEKRKNPGITKKEREENKEKAQIQSIAENQNERISTALSTQTDENSSVGNPPNHVDENETLALLPQEPAMGSAVNPTTTSSWSYANYDPLQGEKPSYPLTYKLHSFVPPAKVEVPERVVKQPKTWVVPYFDLGTFFLYQNVQPNLEDDLVIENFQGTNRFSLKRLGFIAEAGLKKDISEKITVRLGGNFSLLNQSYAFSIRDTDPIGGVVSSTDEVVVSPIFNESAISVDHKLWAVGAKASVDWNILPDKGSSIFSGLSYHHLLNPNHSFTHNDEAQNIHYPNQLLLTLGLRKVLFENRKSNVSLVPNVRYAIFNSGTASPKALSVKPFSAGATVTWSFGRKG